MCYPHKSNPTGEASQNLTANQTQIKRKRGGQKGNRNACKHGFYSGTLSPAETFQLWNITNLEGVDPEIAFIRVKLQSSLQHDPGNRRVIREASRLLVKWYSENYWLDPSDRNYLKAVVENLLETASVRQSAELQSSQKQMPSGQNESYVFQELDPPPYVGETAFEFQKTEQFPQNESFPALPRQSAGPHRSQEQMAHRRNESWYPNN